MLVDKSERGNSVASMGIPRTVNVNVTNMTWYKLKPQLSIISRIASEIRKEPKFNCSKGQVQYSKGTRRNVKGTIIKRIFPIDVQIIRTQPAAIA